MAVQNASKMAWCFPRIHLRKVFLCLAILSTAFVVYYYLKATTDLTSEPKSFTRPRLKPSLFCSLPLTSTLRLNASSDSIIRNSIFNGQKTRVPSKVLLVVKTSFSKIPEILKANRIAYKTTVAGKNLPDLIKMTRGVGKYGVIIFEDFNSYLTMDEWNREILDKYCKTFGAGIIGFFHPEESFKNVNYPDIGLTVKTRTEVNSLSVNKNSSVLRITRGGVWPMKHYIRTASTFWVGIDIKKGNNIYEAVVNASFGHGQEVIPTVILDKGDIPKVIFGSGISRHFIHKLVFLDALQFLSGLRIDIPLTRHILVDIDDIFTGKNRLTKDDVQALLESQDNLAAMVPGFKYNLGFSGSTFKVTFISRIFHYFSIDTLLCIASRLERMLKMRAMII